MPVTAYIAAVGASMHTVKCRPVCHPACKINILSKQFGKVANQICNWSDKWPTNIRSYFVLCCPFPGKELQAAPGSLCNIYMDPYFWRYKYHRSDTQKDIRMRWAKVHKLSLSRQGGAPGSSR